ncbi:phosphotransferase [Actinoplanes sp. DH11]|uniref:phosphotransferase n=1 Tax=Actinoplanes sp. DH11 TaxID=2857011 RepID=UPI001E3D87AF|nr:phosphotransferase [Actinoplanes sp. DH11]
MAGRHAGPAGVLTTPARPAETTGRARPAETTGRARPAETTERGGPAETAGRARPAETTEGDIVAALGGKLVSSQVLAGGFSHRTTLLTLTDRRVVARFGGADPVIEAGVMAVAREHVPVPEVLLLVPGQAMVIEYVDGVPLSAVLDGGDGSAELGAEVGRCVARIAAVTFDRPGFFTGADLAVAAERPWSQQLAEMAGECMESVPAGRLDERTRRAWVRLCAEHAGVLTAVDGHARLVHADINPKNILVARAGAGWRVAAVLDWEFAYSGCPYGDAANMARFGARYPAGFLDAFRAGFAEGLRAAGLPADLRAAGLPADLRAKGLPADLRAEGLIVRQEPADWAYVGRVLDMFALSDLVTRPPGHAVADEAAEQIRLWVRDGVPAR